MAQSDPYKVLGIPHSATDAEIRAAYRRLVQLHHPDHNGGSAESARRFEEVQEAYAVIRKLAPRTRSAGSGSGTGRRASAPPPPRESGDPGLDERLAAMDRELKRQREATREATRADQGDASDEDLGYVTTDDSFSAILDDAAAVWSKRFSESKQDDQHTPKQDDKHAPKQEPVTERIADVLDDWGARLRGEKQRGQD